MSYGIVFPGQGSQRLNMMDGFNEPLIKEIFAHGSDILGKDFWAMLQETDSSNIDKTINTQSLMVIANYAMFKLFTSVNAMPVIIAGHSVGEYSALIAAEVLTFECGLRLVQKRAGLMSSISGKMTAVIGIDSVIVTEACHKISIQNQEIVSPVNFNTHTQTVIAGTHNGIELAKIELKSLGAKTIDLPVSVPAHSVLMESVSIILKKEIDCISFNLPKIPVIQNINANIVNNINGIKENLAKHISNPVEWVKTIELMVTYVENIVECGPNKVLTGLIKKIDKNLNCININSSDDICINF